MPPRPESAASGGGVIQPLDEHGIFAHFLAEKGEGVHHIAIATPNVDDLVTEQNQPGNTWPLSGSFMGIDVAYLPTDRDLGVIFEIYSGMPATAPSPTRRRPPNATRFGHSSSALASGLGRLSAAVRSRAPPALIGSSQPTVGSTPSAPDGHERG